MPDETAQIATFQRKHLEPVPNNVEKACKSIAEWLVRYTLSGLIYAFFYDFFYSPLWLHGYVYAINMNYTKVSNFDDNMLLVTMHEQLFPLGHRVLAGIFTITFIHAALWHRRHTLGHSLTIWKLFRWSAAVGFAAGLLRYLQQRHRIMPLLHDAFFAYLTTLLIALALLIRIRSTLKEKTQ